MTTFSLSLTWSAPPAIEQNGIIRQYIVVIIQSEIGFNLQVTSDTTEVTVDDLQPSYEYNCRVAAETVGVGPFGEIQVTLPEGGKCFFNIYCYKRHNSSSEESHLVPSAPPNNVTGFVINSTSISLSWEPPADEELNGLLREYQVDITEVETGTTFQLSTLATETTIIISSLHPYYNYLCSVSAVTIGLGPFSQILTFLTLQAGM